jgi:hypothetical protein
MHDPTADALNCRIEDCRPAYRPPGSKTTIGWIVLEGGSQIGVQTTGTGWAAMLQLDPENPHVTVEGENIGVAPDGRSD